MKSAVCRWAVAMAFGGLFGGAGIAKAADIKLPETLAWTAYDVGSGGYNQAVSIGNALKNHLKVNLRVLPGKNDVSRGVPLREKKVHFSANGVGGTYLAQEGLYEFGAKDWGPQRLRLLMLNNSDALLTIHSAKDANIKTIYDIKGKRVAWVAGAPSLNQNITAMLAFANLTWNDVVKVEFGGFGAAMEGIIGNQVDAAFSSSISGQAYKIAASPRGLHHPIFPHADKEGWTRMNKIAPFFVPFMGTEGANMSKENPVESTTYPYPTLIAYEDQNGELVYNMTRAMVEFFPDYKDGTPGNNGWDIKRQIFEWVVPYHDGAIRYFKELGVWKPEHQAHNDKLLKRQDALLKAWEGYAKSGPSDEKAFYTGWLKARATGLTQAGFDPVVTE